MTRVRIRIGTAAEHNFCGNTILSTVLRISMPEMKLVLTSSLSLISVFCENESECGNIK